MKPLPFNRGVMDALKPSYQFRLEALPFVMMCAPLIPLVRWAHWLDTPAGATWRSGALGASGAPWQDAQSAGLALAFLLAAMFAMALGFMAGWLFNALWCRYALRRSAEQVKALLMHSEVPTHWYVEGVSTRAEAEARARNAQQQEMGGGLWRYALVRGVLQYGTSMCLATYVIPPVIWGRGDMTVAGALHSLAVWWLAGAALGLAMWWVNQRCHRTDPPGA